tara:strand:+ start:216 stop:407 length:192 start_codon:yes stop_codon:yes gene_type:complete
MCRIVLMTNPIVRNASKDNCETAIGRDCEMDSASDVIKKEYGRDVKDTRIFYASSKNGYLAGK